MLGLLVKSKVPVFLRTYPDDVDCEWKIRDEKGSGIKLTFTDFEVMVRYFISTSRCRDRRYC